MSQHQPRRRRGRPALAENDTSTDVCIKMPSRMYDLTYALAVEQRTTVPDVIRKAIVLVLASDLTPQ